MALSYVSLALRLLLLSHPGEYSAWAIIVLWALRIVSLSLLFRTYVGPSILRLVSKRLQVRSVSLRSIRGIYFRAGSGTWQIERVGISYHRPSATTASRFSLVVEGLKLELAEAEDTSIIKPSLSRTKPQHLPSKSLTPRMRQMLSKAWRVLGVIYASVDPYIRPFIRSTIVGVLRVVIQALPALTHVLDFELQSAVVTLSAIPGVELAVAQVQVHTKVSLSSLGSLVIPESTLARPVQHRRFASVADWNARLASSVRRTWDKAWGATQVTTSLSVRVKDISGTSSALALNDLPSIPSVGMVPFVDIASTEFTVSLRIDPHRAIQPHSVTTSLSLDAVNLNIDVVKYLMKALKKEDRTLDTPIDRTQPNVQPTFSPPLRPSSLESRRMTWSSPMSPGSPLREALSSASVRFGWGFGPTPARKLNRRDDAQTHISMFKAVSFNVNKLTLRHCLTPVQTDVSQVFAVTMNNLHLGGGLSHPDINSMHRQYLGSRSVPNDDLSADVYRLDFSVSSLTLDRFGSGAVVDHLQVISVDLVKIDAVVSQWPFPWVCGPTFMSGDPNSQLLAVNLELGSIRLTERLEVLQSMLANRPSPKPHSESRTLLPSVLSPLPRVAFGMKIGPVLVRLISTGTSSDEGPFALEARTDGFMTSFDSQYRFMTDKHLSNMAHDHPGLQMDFYLKCALHRTFVSVCFGSDMSEGHHPGPLPGSSSYPGENLLSLEAIEISGHGSSLGDIADELHGAVTMDVPSLFTELHCSTEAISIELWQPGVIGAVRRMARTFGGSPKPPVKRDSPQYVLDHLPFGIAASVAVGRLVVFVTGPDIAPGDELELTRGVAIHSGISFSYCAVHSKHSDRIRDLLPRSQKRLSLSLPSENIVKAVAGATVPSAMPNTRVLLGIALWDVGLRDAIATRFTADDPYCYADGDGSPASRESVRIKSIDVDVILSGMRPNGSYRPGVKDDLLITVLVSKVRGSLRLAHIYNMLLAAKTLKTLTPASPKPVSKTVAAPSTLALHFQSDLRELQVLFEFPLRSKMFARISNLRCQLLPEEAMQVKWSSLTLAVAATTLRDGREKENWEELVRLTDWRVTIPSSTRPPSLLVEGDSGRLHIPFDFVLADLILDINLTVKSSKHLIRMVAAGKYSQPPAPEAEEAKIVPDITIKVRCLTVQAADEDLESNLGLIWRAGSEASRVRLERDEAFEAKASVIRTSHGSSLTSKPGDVDPDFHFGNKHTVSVDNARQRLHQVHSVAWRSAFVKAKQTQAAREVSYAYYAARTRCEEDTFGDLVRVNPLRSIPPLFRLTFDSLSLHLIAPPSLINNVPDFLFAAGNGLPKDTEFSLLVPLHLNFTVASLRFSFREYPLPLLNIPPNTSEGSPALEFDGHVVIAEEMGTESSVEWFPAEVVPAHQGLHGAAHLSIMVPKTIMPVKTYAEPTIRVLTSGTTDFSWGVSYGAATQDLMRIIDTLSHAPRDCSPPIGFWDKLRLVFHWRLKVLFAGDIHLHMKGSRDPYSLKGPGAGFALCWSGNPQLLIGQPNDQNELIQVISDSMLVIIPNLVDTWGDGRSEGQLHMPSISSVPFTESETSKSREPKVCAKLSSGVRFGVGFALERACGPECQECSGKPFDRKCRFFDFKPHYNVKLETKEQAPEPKSAEDSYNGFRSDFIHMSLSLTSAVHKGRRHLTQQQSSIHLSPEVFEHFWAWYHLFDGALSLPIRQGPLYARKRPVSPKLGQHLATLKYRISFEKIFISHLYVDNSRDAWADGVTPYVGVKTLIDHFQADMHQRDQESTRIIRDGPKAIHHKAFYAIEVVTKGLDLRSMLAVFEEPLKQQVRMESSPLLSNYRTKIKADPISAESLWLDADDFSKPEWAPSAPPTVYLLPAARCPQFTYFKRAVDNNESPSGGPVVRSKFGNEDTHTCYLGKEASVTQVQIALTAARIRELEHKLEHTSGQCERSHSADCYDSSHGLADERSTSVRKNIALLNSYGLHLEKIEASAAQHNYYMPSEAVSQEEWAEFDNVYQLHFPQIFMNQTIRDIMMQYYYCSRAKRGIEYHMATRAVKFIRDQAKSALADLLHESDGPRGPVASAQAAAAAVRNFLTGDGSTGVESVSYPIMEAPGAADPLDGWSQGVSLRKSDFCLLLKPQIVLRSEATAESDADSVCVLAAVQGKMKSYNIMDDANADDPISGKVMSRNFASVTGLQTFSPSASNKSGDEYVPLEVLIDLRCENSQFDRLVPQTDASLQYDKFNRLRLRTNAASLTRSIHDANHPHDHLQNHTDLVRVHVPRFTVSANDQHFQFISNIVTKLILFSDAALKDRADKLEKMLFSYDFTNLASAADVVANMQARLRHALETRREAVQRLQGFGDDGKVEVYKIDAHIFLLADELNLIFDAIKLAQDKANEGSEQKSALLLHASSSEISWGMLDRQDQLLAKLAVRDIHFYWLSRQDSSTVNNLVVGDLQAFDGSADAEWTEILSRYDEPSSHPLVKQKLFLVADWTVLPPVGGITIYERFEITFHPMRLQIDTRVGRKIMEYVWPARRHRHNTEDEVQAFDDIPESPSAFDESSNVVIVPESPMSPRRSSWDVSPRAPRQSYDSHRLAPASPLRKLGASRSFTDLRNTMSDSMVVPKLHKTRSTDALLAFSSPSQSGSKVTEGLDRRLSARSAREIDDATVMKTRSSQKTFVWVKVNSLHLLLSIAKEDSFLCRDARIRTRALEYRNQTWSFEELVDQFIPSGRNWRGWVKMAFQQPLVPVLPVARELISKTKWISNKSHHSHTQDERPNSPSLFLPFHGRHNNTSATTSSSSTVNTPSSTTSETKRQRGISLFSRHSKSQPILAKDLTAEPEPLPEDAMEQVAAARSGRVRVLSVFKRKHTTGPRSSMDSDVSAASTASRRTASKARPSGQHSREDQH